MNYEIPKPFPESRAKRKKNGCKFNIQWRANKASKSWSCRSETRWRRQQSRTPSDLISWGNDETGYVPYKMGSGSQSQRSQTQSVTRARTHTERINEGEEDPIERNLVFFLIIGSLGVRVSLLSSPAASSSSNLELCLLQLCSKHKRQQCSVSLASACVCAQLTRTFS